MNPLKASDRAQRMYASLVALHNQPSIAGCRPLAKDQRGMPPRTWFERCFQTATRAVQGEIDLERFDERMARWLPCPELRTALYQGPEPFLKEYQATLGAVQPGMRKAIATAFSCHYNAPPRPPWVLL